MDATEIVILVLLSSANYLIILALPLIYAIAYKKTRAIYAVSNVEGQLEREWKGSLISALIPPAMFGFLFYTGMLSIQANNESWLNVLATFVAVFVWTEIWSYYSHLALHTKPLLFMHRHHHKSRPPAPISTLSFSFLEKFLTVAGILLPFLLIKPYWQISVYGLVGYFFFYYFINSIGHCNFELLPKRYIKTIGKFTSTSTFHVMHHARYKGNYGLTLIIFDKLHRTVHEDYEKLFERAIDGKPLQSMRDKLS